MKKIITITIVTMMFICSSYAQTDTSKLTLNKVYSDIKVGIASLSQSLKVPATHVYGILVKQQVANSIISICLIVVLLITAIISVIVAIKMYNKAKVESNSYPIETTPGLFFVVFSVGSAFLAIGCIIMICSTMESIVIGFTNPEYGAIKEIISIVK